MWCLDKFKVSNHALKQGECEFNRRTAGLDDEVPAAFDGRFAPDFGVCLAAGFDARFDVDFAGGSTPARGGGWTMYVYRSEGR